MFTSHVTHLSHHHILPGGEAPFTVPDVSLLSSHIPAHHHEPQMPKSIGLPKPPTSLKLSATVSKLTNYPLNPSHHQHPRSYTGSGSNRQIQHTGTLH
ncbi:uncharacterized protein BDZ99DRAFT_467329 [Mytilinidion resinicola]|uniref:Uncharacterized protein n=1 Tax=Mytilinidion resinicola TaxID=574789 RepID=A0A6A6Y7X7_9PEZI|nr:uncharacterized protein BDZ99DRAFT_467329 [Mytilinidion resinicola]KAF2804643.1 hypothetical protein BDZ99DRAFT_467329 [Mytilinidion resinicola]